MVERTTGTKESLTFDRPWPLGNLSPQSFERFCTDFLEKLFINARVNRYGDHGHKQHGLDIEIAYPDGRYQTAQCKRVTSFTPAQIKKVVHAHTRHADFKFLLLSCIASPQVRDEIREHAEWELWDKEDITRYIRQNLSKLDQTQLVDSYFPGQRFELLGELDTSFWLTPQEYFQGMTENPNGFSHGWRLVGRQEELNKLLNFCTGQNTVLFLTANAGMGKTRLLKAFTDSLQENHSHQRVYFAGREQATSKSFDVFAREPKIIICDDAHERDDLALFFDYALAPKHQARLIIVFRRYALTHVTRRAQGYQITKIPEVKLRALELNEAKALAQEALTHYRGTLNFSDNLAQLTKDLPVALVMGAQVLAQSSSHPQFLLNQEDFYSEIMRFTIAEQAEFFQNKYQHVKINHFLGALALLQPIGVNDEPVFSAIAQVSGEIQNFETTQITKDLLDSGILFKSGGKYRIAPDLLADFLIEQTCIGLNGESTGFAEKLFAILPEYSTENILLNLGRLDWKKSAGNTRQSRLLDFLWVKLEWKNDFSSPHLSAAASVAYYQPEQALKFVKKLLEQGKVGD